MINHVLHEPHGPRTAVVFNGSCLEDLLCAIPKNGTPAMEWRNTKPHALLKDLLNKASAVHGQALLVDVISNPRSNADVVINDLNGCSCSPNVTSAAASLFRSHGLSVAFNNSGNTDVIRTAMNYDSGHHTVQLDLALDLWTDDKLEYDEKKAGSVKTMLSSLSIQVAKLMVA